MIDTKTSDDSANPSDSGDSSIFGPVQITRVMILVVTILCAIAFWYAAKWMAWPTEYKFRGSLAQPPMALGSFLTAIVLLVALTILSTLVLGRRWFLAGLMAAAAGLATWSVRGGTMTQVLFNAENAGVGQAIFLKLMGELIVFYAIIGGLWNLIWQQSGRAMASSGKAGRRVTLRSAGSAENEEGRSTIVALLVQVAAMVVLLLLFVATPMKKQVLTAVFLASVISTAVAEYFFADRRAGRWYWIAPLIVGAFGYIWGYFSPMGIELGDLNGTFAALTRVLPLDYASMGCAGVLFGYWWMEPDAESNGDEVAVIVGPTVPHPSADA